MTAEQVWRSESLERAREIIMRDESIPVEEKEGLFKLVQILIESANVSPGLSADADKAQLLTQEIISKHALVALVQQQADELDALRKLSLSLTSSLDLQTVLDAVVREAMRLVKNARTAHIFLYTRGKVQFGASLNFEGVQNLPVSIPRKNGLTYTVAIKGEMIMVEDMSHHPLYQNAPSSWQGSIIGIPLKINNGVVGVMNLSRSTVGKFRPEELRLLGLLADQAAVAISNASLHQIVMEQAKTDMVTGLPNRRALDERLEEETRLARKRNTPFAVIMMDLDGFKAVNDTHGHAIGDEVLRAAFNYLAGGMRSIEGGGRTADFLARYGGDELTLVLSNTDLPKARIVTEKVLTMMREFMFLLPDGHKIHLGVSGGIAVYPNHSRNGIDLLRAADAALYEAKKHNRGGFSVAKEATAPLGPLDLPSP